MSENKDAQIIAIRKVPVITHESPDWGERIPLGFVAAEVETKNFHEAMDFLETTLSIRAVEKFNGSARICYNFQWVYEEGVYGWRTYRATADVYGDYI